MNRFRMLVLMLAALALALSACVAQPAAPAEEPMENAATPAAEEEMEAMPAPGSQEEFEKILACVEENFPAQSYFTNEYLPASDAAWEPMDCESVDSIKVGMPWVLNDEEAPWYNAIELGYFADVCLEVELVAGGPGLDHLQTLAGGAVDIAVVAGGSTVPSLVSSPTPADVVAVGTFLKHSPYVWLGLDPDTPQDQRSDKVLTPEDFIGSKVGLQPGNDYLFLFFANKHGIDHDAVELVDAGFTPDPVLLGAMDYIGAWIMNQPRLMEEKGYMNWVAFQFSDWGWDGYGDVTVVRRETLEENPDLVRRFLAAQTQGLSYLLENPDESAEIAVVYGVDAQLTKEQALRRFELQEPLVRGTDDLPVSHMSAERWNTQVASMIQYDQLQLDACE